MKKTVTVCSVLCAVAALASLVMGIRVLTGHGFFIGLRIFSMAEQGTFIGFIGNLLGIAVACLGFGALAVCGLGGLGLIKNAQKNGFIFGLIMTGICLISMIAAIFSGSFSIGDLFILALPAIYTYAVLKSA